MKLNIPDIVDKLKAGETVSLSRNTVISEMTELYKVTKEFDPNSIVLTHYNEHHRFDEFSPIEYLGSYLYTLVGEFLSIMDSLSLVIIQKR